MNPSTGQINVAATVPVGTYTVSYYICDPNEYLCNHCGAKGIATINVLPCNSSVDLYIKDSPNDDGTEPNTTTQYMWNSEDIWVRNNLDNSLVHENPDYSPITPSYIYVRIKNRSCVASTGNEKLKLYWAKAATSLYWPQSWIYDSSASLQMGSQLCSINIPVLQPNQEIILHYPWHVPNPADYTAINTEPWHFCLLSRIESTTEPMNPLETDDLNANVGNNNNIAWRNVTVVDVIPDPDIIINPNPLIGGVVAVGNPFNEPHTFYLELVKENLETGNAIFDEAEVGIKMDEILYHAWVKGGKEAQEIDGTLDERKKIVKGNNVIIDNISFDAKETGTLNLTFNFLTKEITDKSKFVYHVVQRDSETGKIIGGETYVINKNPRPLFIADGGGVKEVDKNEVITISANQINEAAIYNWYDADGNLVYQGKDLTISTDVAKKYRLEVIALSDGFKDYSDVDVILKPSTLGIISPNPATSNFNITYKLNEVSSAYLMVLGTYETSGASNNYILNLDSSEINLNLSDYVSGFYIVALVCDGKIIDAKTLIKE